MQSRIVTALVAVEKNGFRVHGISLGSEDKDVDILNKLNISSGSAFQRITQDHDAKDCSRRCSCRVGKKDPSPAANFLRAILWQLFSLFLRSLPTQKPRHLISSISTKLEKTIVCRISYTILLLNILPMTPLEVILLRSSTKSATTENNQPFVYTTSSTVEWLQHGSVGHWLLRQQSHSLLD
jgi:hypothetical protein